MHADETRIMSRVGETDFVKVYREIPVSREITLTRFNISRTSPMIVISYLYTTAIYQQ